METPLLLSLSIIVAISNCQNIISVELLNYVDAYSVAFFVHNANGTTPCGDSVDNLYIWYSSAWTPADNYYYAHGDKPAGSWGYIGSGPTFVDLAPLDVRISMTSGRTIVLQAIITTITPFAVFPDLHSSSHFITNRRDSRRDHRAGQQRWH
eukprot:991227_1